MLRLLDLRITYVTAIALFALALSWNGLPSAAAAGSHDWNRPTLTAHGPSLPPDPEEEVIIGHGPSLPPDPEEEVIIGHGPSLPPDPEEEVIIGHGPSLPPDPEEEVIIGIAV